MRAGVLPLLVGELEREEGQMRLPVGLGWQVWCLVGSSKAQAIRS